MLPTVRLFSLHNEQLNSSNLTAWKGDEGARVWEQLMKFAGGTPRMERDPLYPLQTKSQGANVAACSQ